MIQNPSQEMTCSECQTHIEEYIAGELDSPTEFIITSHLNACEKCQHELSLAQTIGTVLNELPKPTAPPAILHEITAYVQTHPNENGWFHRFTNLFEWENPRTIFLRVCALTCLVGIVLFGFYQHKKYVIVQQAKNDFNYAISMMQYAVNKTGLAVNDSFGTLKIDEAPRRALKSTSTISSAIDRSLGILNRLTEDVSNTETIMSQTQTGKFVLPKNPNDLAEKPNNPIQGENKK